LLLTLTKKEDKGTALMRMEDREEYVDMVAQAVIDRIEERDRLAVLVDQVVRRVLELQEKQAALAIVPEGPPSEDGTKEIQDAGE